MPGTGGNGTSRSFTILDALLQCLLKVPWSLHTLESIKTIYCNMLNGHLNTLSRHEIGTFVQKLITDGQFGFSVLARNNGGIE